METIERVDEIRKKFVLLRALRTALVKLHEVDAPDAFSPSVNQILSDAGVDRRSFWPAVLVGVERIADELVSELEPVQVALSQA